jgi:hypothetical protein
LANKIYGAAIIANSRNFVENYTHFMGIYIIRLMDNKFFTWKYMAEVI